MKTKQFILFLIILISGSITAKKPIHKFNKKHSGNKSTVKTFDHFNITIDDYRYNFSSKDSFLIRYYSDSIGQRKVKVILTNNEKELIYKKAREIDFYSMPREIEGNGISISGEHSTEICIFDGSTKKCVWIMACCVKDENMKKKFYEFISFIFDIIETRKEVKLLPPSDRVDLL